MLPKSAFQTSLLFAKEEGLLTFLRKSLACEMVCLLHADPHPCFISVSVWSCVCLISSCRTSGWTSSICWRHSCRGWRTTLKDGRRTTALSSRSLGLSGSDSFCFCEQSHFSLRRRSEPRLFSDIHPTLQCF